MKSGRRRSFDATAALACAQETFWQEGFHGATLEVLLGRMRIRRQSAYNAFGSKDQLFRSALTQYIQGAEARFAQLLTTGPSPLGRVRGLLRRIAAMTARRSRRGCFITNTIVELAPHHAGVRRQVSQVLARLEELLTATFAQAVAAGELPAGRDPRRLARTIVVLFEGCLVVCKTNRAAIVHDALATAELLLEPSR